MRERDAARRMTECPLKETSAFADCLDVVRERQPDVILRTTTEGQNRIR